MDILNRMSMKHMKGDVPEFEVGDTVDIEINVREGNNERKQKYQGIVIQRRGEGIGETFTVRKVSSGIGVERVFPLHSPNVISIKVVRKGSVRRAKLFYLRELKGKAARVKEKKK